MQKRDSQAQVSYSHHYLPVGYKERESGKKGFVTSIPLSQDAGTYALASYLKVVGKLELFIDLGCGFLDQKEVSFPDNQIVSVGDESKIKAAKRRGLACQFVCQNLESPINISDRLLERSVVVCHHQLETSPDPLSVLRNIITLAEKSPFVVIGLADRNKNYLGEHLGPPTFLKRKREWSIDDLRSMAESFNFNDAFIGNVVSNGALTEKKDMVVILGSHAAYQEVPLVKTLAIVSCFNDEDIIRDSIEHLIKEDVDVYVVDNWSSDETWSLLKKLQEDFPARVIGIERFPSQAPDSQYNWHGILNRKEVISKENAARYKWFIHYDSDEQRTSPWPNVSLGRAISFIDSLGYNAIDHTLIDFRPTRDGFDSDRKATDFFSHFEFNGLPSGFSQIKGWRGDTNIVDLKSSGGHSVEFEGRRTFPLKFLLSHYPLRSTSQAQKKIFRDRLKRYASEERTRGWHVHYKQYENREDASFVWNEDGLTKFDPQTFFSEFLLERLTGINIRRTCI